MESTAPRLGDAGAEAHRRLPHVASVVEGNLESERSPLVMFFRIETREGVGIEGAEVGWTSADTERVGNLAWMTSPRSPRPPPVLRSDQDGMVERSALEALATGEGVRYLWISAAGFMARGFVLLPGAEPPQTIVLEPGGILEVHVRDDLGRSLAGCEVITAARPAVEGDPRDPELRPYVHRLALTDELGVARLPQLGPRQGFVAYQGALRSPPWAGSAPARVETSLLSPATIAGRLQLSGASGSIEELVIQAVARTPEGEQWVGESPATSERTWGPLVFSPTSGAELVLRLEGGDFVPIEKVIPMPPPGSVSGVDFEPRAGVSITVRVVEVGGEPIANASAEILWEENGTWHGVYASTDTQGLARVRGCRPGAAWLQVHREGYASFAGEEALAVGPAQGAPYEVILLPSATLTGRVIADGSPVSAFQVALWDPETAMQHVESFVERTDGSFSLEAPGRGVIEVLAFAPGYAPSTTQRIDVGERLLDGGILLELQPAAAAQGVVVNALDGTPIASAEIAVAVLHRGQRAGILDPPVRSNARGEFLIQGLGQEPCSIELNAEGFTSRSIERAANPAGLLDLGRIALVPLRDLFVRLVGAEEGAQESYSLELAGASPRATHRFGQDGLAVLEGVPSGFHRLTVTSPMGIRYSRHLQLEGGSSWEVEFDVTSDAEDGIELIAEVERLPSGFDLSGLEVIVVSSTQGQESQRRLRLPPNGRILVPGPLGDVTMASWVTPRPQTLGSVIFRAADHRGSPVRLPYHPFDRPVRVVDTQGNPVAGCSVRVFAADLTSEWAWTETTNLEGLVFLSGLSIGPLDLWAVHGTRGVSPVVRIQDPLENSEPSLVLPAGSGLELHFRDGRTDLEGLRAMIQGPAGQPLARLSASDSGGKVRTMPLAEGAYRVRVAEPGFWPMEAEIAVGPASSPASLQVRRIGTLLVELEVMGAAAVNSLRLELFNEEFGCSAEPWIQSGAVQSSSRSMTIDAPGTIRFSGLPHGAYTWAVHPVDAAPLSGSVTVRPHAVEVLSLAIGS